MHRPNLKCSSFCAGLQFPLRHFLHSMQTEACLCADCWELLPSNVHWNPGIVENIQIVYLMTAWWVRVLSKLKASILIWLSSCELDNSLSSHAISCLKLSGCLTDICASLWRSLRWRLWWIMSIQQANNLLYLFHCYRSIKICTDITSDLLELLSNTSIQYQRTHFIIYKECK